MSENAHDPAGAVAGDTADTQTPTLSVVMPVRDVADWVTEAVWSVLNQSLRSIEIIIVDDGSTDGTREMVESIARHDARVRVLANAGRGGAAARNLGVAVARGEFLAFADGDDVVPSRAYERLVDQAQRSGVDMVVGNHMVIETQRTLTRNQSLPIYLVPRHRISLVEEPRFLRDRVCWNRVVRRSAWVEMGIEFADSRRSNDILAMVQCYCAFEFDVVAEPVYAYRRRVGASSMTASKLQADSLSDHFEQETACYEAVAALGDETVLRVYFEGILEHDIWAHGRALMTQISLGDASFDRARHLVEALVRVVPSEVFDRVSERKALAYRLVESGRWDIADLFAEPIRGAEARTSLAASDWRVLEDYVSLGGPPTLLAALLRQCFLEPLVALPGDSTLIHGIAAVTARVTRYSGLSRTERLQLEMLRRARLASGRRLATSIRAARLARLPSRAYGRLRRHAGSRFRQLGLRK